MLKSKVCRSNNDEKSNSIVTEGICFADKSNDKVYIMMEARLVALFKTSEEYEILDRFKGDTLKGKTYLPLFPYFAHVTSNIFI